MIARGNEFALDCAGQSRMNNVILYPIVCTIGYLVARNGISALTRHSGEIVACHSAPMNEPMYECIEWRVYEAALKRHCEYAH